MASNQNRVDGPANQPVFDPSGIRGEPARFVTPGYGEITFSYPGPVDELVDAPAWHAPYNILIYEVVIAARTAGTDDVTVSDCDEAGSWTLHDGNTFEAYTESITLLRNERLCISTVDVGAGDVEDLSIQFRYRATLLV